MWVFYLVLEACYGCSKTKMHHKNIIPYFWVEPIGAHQLMDTDTNVTFIIYYFSPNNLFLLGYSFFATPKWYTFLLSILRHKLFALCSYILVYRYIIFLLGYLLLYRYIIPILVMIFTLWMFIILAKKWYCFTLCLYFSWFFFTLNIIP